MGLDQKELDKILEWFNKSNLTSATVEGNVEGDYKITLSREQTMTPISHVAHIQTPDASTTTVNESQTESGVHAASSDVERDTSLEDVKDVIEITSPIVGTFYRAPGPDSPPFVQIGDTVKKGSTLCILEAMKVMNELEAEFDMQIVSVLKDSGDLAEFGQAIFEVKAL